MPRSQYEFQNASGLTLSGLLEMPEHGQPHATAVFAHCFTCGKQSRASTRISKALAEHGIAVLRFDFTGLGGSEGEFANSHFSANVQDLLAASEALATTHTAPSLLIGHSLGGAAVLHASSQLPSVRAVATVGAPATADHVQHLFAAQRDDILQAGEAEVTLGGRRFTLNRQFVEDMQSHHTLAPLAKLDAALLVFHSPEDAIVPIEEASRIYKAARHPKSFVSLSGADHLLLNADDAQYVATTLAAWATRYLPATEAPDAQPSDTPTPVPGEVVVRENDHTFKLDMQAGGHHLIADEPSEYGGSDAGPGPYDYLLMGLGACTVMTLRMYATRKQLNLTDISIALQHDRIHAADCADCGDRPADARLDRITLRITLTGSLNDAERQRVLEIAGRCPVHRTLKNDPVIVAELTEPT